MRYTARPSHRIPLGCCTSSVRTRSARLIEGFDQLVVALRNRELDQRLSDSGLTTVSQAMGITDPSGVVLSTNEAHEFVTD